MNLKEALKAALDGKKIRHKEWTEGEITGIVFEDGWFRAGGFYWSPHTYHALTDEWEIIHEPVKYSVDVWFGETPKCDPEEHDLLGLVFGWSSYSSTKCNGFKKYRVTVEEVAEDK